MTDKNINQFLFSYHLDRINNYKSRLLINSDDTEEARLKATKELYYKSRYWQCNIPYHELEVLMSGDIFDKNVREYDLVSKRYKDQSTLYTSFFSKYLDEVDGKVFDRGLSLLFYGLNESGKTIAAIHALSMAIQSGMSGYYIHFRDLMQCYNAAAFDSEYKERKLWNYILNCDFLVIDEVGKESNVTDNIISVFEKIVKHRSSDIKPTIVITNLNIAGQGKSGNLLLDRYGNSVYSSLITRYRAFEFSPRGRFREKTREDWDL